MTFGQFMFWFLLVLLFFAYFGGIAIRNRRVDEHLAENGFEPTFMFRKGLFSTGIAIDRQNEGVALLWPMNRMPTLLDFSEIVAVEVRRNEQVIERTNRKRQLAGAAVGGLAFGRLGAVVGGVSASRRHESRVTKLALVVFTSDMDAPSAEIVFFSSMSGVSPRNAALHERTLENWRGRLLGIIAQQD